MIQLYSNGSTRPLAFRNLFFAFCIISIILFALDCARRVHSENIESSGLFYSFSHGNSDQSPREARILSAQELLARPLTSNLTTVPKLFHQSWSNATLPAKFEKWSRSCRRAHPNWEWVLWTDQDNLDLVRKHASWFANTYEDLEDRIPVYRADVARNLYMHLYGGYVNNQLL